MKWRNWKDAKPDFCRPIVLFWVDPICDSFVFMEGEYDPREIFVATDHHSSYAWIDGRSRWVYKEELAKECQKD